MAHRMRFTSSTGFTEARRELAAEVRDLADRLDSQEPDHSASHDAWEVLVELAEQAESLRAHFFGRHPEQEAWLTEERPWLDPKLQLIGKPSRSPRSRAARPRRKQRSAQSSL
jgi:hypothetical protein